MGYQAPKIQSTNMAPRQAAVGRALQKPKKQGAYSSSEPGSFNPNTTMGMQNPSHSLHAGKGPRYGPLQNAGKPGRDVNGNPVTNPVAGVLKGGRVQQPVVGPAGVAGVGPADPLGTGDPELDKYLAGDETYQSILASIQRNKDMSKGTYDYNVNSLNTDNETIKRRLAESEVKDNQLLDDDYAARGMFNSGLSVKAGADLGKSYFNQGKDLELTLKRNLDQLFTDQTSQNALDDETARQAQLDAITRRAQEFGIMGGPSNLTAQPGKDGKDGKNGKNGKDGKKGKGKGKK